MIYISVPASLGVNTSVVLGKVTRCQQQSEKEPALVGASLVRPARKRCRQITASADHTVDQAADSQSATTLLHSSLPSVGFHQVL